MEPETEVTKKEKNKKVSRFGRERYEDGPVEYKPIIRQGGRKIKTTDGTPLKVPVKSSLSNPMDIIRSPKRGLKEEALSKSKETADQEIIKKKQLKTTGKNSLNTVKEVDIESIMDIIPEDDDDDYEDITPIDQTEINADENRKAFFFDESEYRHGDVVHKTILTPCEKRKKAIKCGIPARFFYAMSKGGYLDGEITEETSATAVRHFMAAKIQEKVSNGDVTPKEIDMVAREIRKIRQGISNIIDLDDITPDSTPDDIFRIILEEIRLQNRR